MPVTLTPSFSPGALLADLRLVVAFMTRLPVAPSGGGGGDMARALRLAPLAGLLVGAVGALVYWAAWSLGLGVWPAALLAVLTTVILTGALHEDGLADCADGLGVTGPPAKRIAVMRDSHIGAFGAIALIFSIGLRAAALAALILPAKVLLALIGAHAMARALLVVVMALIATTGHGGLAASIDRPGTANTGLALFLGVALLLATFGLGTGLVAMIVALLVALLTAFWAKRTLGGLTGDTLGAIEQLTEIVLLLTAVALL